MYDTIVPLDAKIKKEGFYYKNMRKESRLILSLDVLDRDLAMRIASETAGYLAAIKVSYPLILNCGLEIVDELAEFSDIICDFKVADTPNTNGLIVRTISNTKAKGVIAHAFPGIESLKACKDNLELYVVVEMSQPGAEIFEKYSEHFIEMAIKVKADGIIAPGNKIERLRYLKSIVKDRLSILCPGIGAQGGIAEEALRSGADYIIVGRSIYMAENPKEKVIEYVRQM